MSDPNRPLDQTDADNFYLAEENRVLREELAANRACNLYTWKERAQKAEAEAGKLVKDLAQARFDAEVRLIDLMSTAQENRYLKHLLTSV